MQKPEEQTDTFYGLPVMRRRDFAFVNRREGRIKFMKPFAWILCTLFFPLVALSAPTPGQASSRTWITDVTIISPENLNHIATGSVLIENGRIVRIERKQRVSKPPDVVVVSGKGLFLIPGLIDSHVHLASVPGMDFDQMGSTSPMVQKYYQQLPRSYLYYGYTTLVDLAVIDHQVLQNFRNAPLHPDLYDCGESLPIANGYPMSFAPPATRFKVFPNFIYDPKQTSTIPAEYKPEDHTPAADVAAVKRSGGVCVKTYFERGFGRDRNLPVISPETLAQIREAATQNGLVLMIHANSFEAQKFGVDGNVDVLAHGMWNWGGLDGNSELPPEVRQVLDQIVAKRIGYQPTIQVLQGLAVYFDSEYLKRNEISKVIPKEMLDWFNSPGGKWFKKEPTDEHTPDAAMLEAYNKGPLRRVRQVVAYLAAKDADFLFATDTPSAPTYGNLPGLNGYLETQQLGKAGLSLRQIFRAATINNAQKFKIDSEVGTIEPGKMANLLLLKQSPLESLDAYDSIVTIWIHGEAVSRESLAMNPEK
jgi:imidazolonepropionase-like amidohydrolase